MQIKTLLFDLDGTLIDSGDDLADAVNHTLDVLHFPPLDRDEIISYIGDGVQVLIRRSLDGVQSSHSVDEALDIFLNYYKAHCTVHTRPYTGVIETLEKLATTHTLVVVTNKGEEMARLILEQLNMTHFFAAIIGGNTLTVKKPDVKVVEHINTLLSVERENMIMIGDHHTDLATAEAAHIPSIFCTFGMGQTKGLQPTHRVDSFAHIADILTHF